MTQSSTVKSINPATKELIGELPCTSRDEVKNTVVLAIQAFRKWQNTNYEYRAKKIKQLRKVISQEKDQIATLISNEVGKPLAESYLAELAAVLDACSWFAENTKKLLTDQIMSMSNPLLLSKKSIITFEPLGVVAIISPWNYPFAIPMITMIMAVMAGNTIILKPSEKSSLTGTKIGELFQKAGFEKDVVSVITGDHVTGQYLVESNVQKIIFTGSVNAGSQIMSGASKNLTPVSLELGGKDAAIVLPNSPIDWTAQGLVWSAFTNCGQACASLERLYIVRSKNTNQLIDSIVKYTSKLQIGSAIDPKTEIGPLIDQAQLDKVISQVDEAKKQGAKVLCGGQRKVDLPGYFYEPTILVDVNHQMTIMTKETFGPVLPIMVVDSQEEAIKLANESEYGLSASIWSGNAENAEKIAHKLEVGTVFINDSLFSFACPQIPWGGLKKSGFGKSHSYFGLLDLVNIKHISIDNPSIMKRLWWFPYGKSGILKAQGGIKFLHGSSLQEKISGSIQFIKNLF